MGHAGGTSHAAPVRMSCEGLKSLLVRRKMVAAEHIQRAVAQERSSETTWLEHLLLERILDEEVLADWVARDSKVPRCAEHLLANVPERAIRQIPWEIAVAHRLVAVLVDTEGYLHVAMV